MTTVGGPALAGDTGARATSSRKAGTVTAAKVQAAPGSNPGRPQIAMTNLPPLRAAEWFTPYGPNGPCGLCRAKILARVERAGGGAALRVRHAKSCTR